MVELFSQFPLVRVLVLGLLFVAVVAVSFAGASALAAREVTRRRVAEAGVATGRFGAEGTSLRADTGESAWARLVETIEKRGLSLVDSKDESLRAKLVAAGFTAPYAPRLYTLIRLALVIGLPLLSFGMLLLSGSSPGLVKLYFMLVISAAFGLYMPALFVQAKAERRREALVHAFPDALDLLLVCVEGGLGLEAAFARVGMELTHAHPLLAEQFGEVVLELRAGRSREDALRRMADRAGVDEIRAFATLLIQSTKLGSSIGQTLRTYAAEMREKRRMRAEEKAHRLPVLLSVPLVACMLPTMIGVLMLPAAIRVVRSLVPALGG
ncbi:type II secretion system F family protein [Sphingomonas sp. BN140010]|uniref:Type II secretion system F family protein n=1 Tax=Sphingomonas arvum TaxID=2992113 RepID=A0ABT3JDM4_9SPHN|nr:type II secretion system F family protein [Sphingomonas sp. BN140010]MCW3797183.1 type II secretion system F family protein [Sphingomonas sp. BN140010]